MMQGTFLYNQSDFIHTLICLYCICINRSADCWSLGIILFFMITGIYPYEKPLPETDTGYWCIKQKKMDLLLVKLIFC